ALAPQSCPAVPPPAGTSGRRRGAGGAGASALRLAIASGDSGGVARPCLGWPPGRGARGIDQPSARVLLRRAAAAFFAGGCLGDYVLPCAGGARGGAGMVSGDGTAAVS